MIMVTPVRYSGWPVGASWVAIVIKDGETDAVYSALTEMVDCLLGGDSDAEEASDFIKMHCHLAGGETAEKAVAALFAKGVLCDDMRGYGFSGKVHEIGA